MTYKNGLQMWNLVVGIVLLMLISEVIRLRQQIDKQPQILKVK